MKHENEEVRESAQYTKAKAKGGRVPRLRFPEFKGTGPWNEYTLCSIAKIVDEHTQNRKVPAMSIASGIGLVLQTEKFGKDIAGEQYKNYIVLKKNDFAYNKSSTKQYPQGFIAMLEDYDEAAVPPSIFTCFRLTQCQIVPDILKHLFHANYHGRYVKKYISIGARAHGALTIDDQDILRIPIALPQNEEQRKIAACLSSLDELISAHERKLEALADYKKGLMQRLFPTEGRSMPRLRFKEFRDAGIWGKKEIGEVFQVTRGYVLPMTIVSDNYAKETPYPVYSSQTKNKGLAGYYSEYLYEDAITWTTDGANAGDVNYRPGRFYCTNVCGVLLNSEGYANKCVAELINAVSKKHVSYVGNPKLMNGVMSKIEIRFPNVSEQRKIASTLSSLDDLIAAEKQKIEELKEHKRGLMQGLFPALEEDE